MKKLVLTILFIVALSSISFANCIGDISQVGNASCITEYSDDTVIENMDTVTFGSYPQSDVSGNTKEPIEWIVLDKQGNKALLLSKNVLCMKALSLEGGAVSYYAGSQIQTWLTNDFYNAAFNDYEKSTILNDSTFACFHGDKVFTLNEKMVKKYFNITASTWKSFYDSSEVLSDDDKNEFNSEAIFSPKINKIESYQTNYSRLFSSSVNEDYIAGYNMVGLNGYAILAFLWNDEAPLIFNVSKNGMVYADTMSPVGIRPAIWVNLTNIQNTDSQANTEADSLGKRVDLFGEEVYVGRSKDTAVTGKITVSSETKKQELIQMFGMDPDNIIVEGQETNVQETTKAQETKPAPKNGWDGDYYYQNDVPVKNTWVDYGSDKYYCGSTGAIVKNQWIDSTYYVDNTGKMLKNTTTPDGYKVGADGKYIEETKVAETKAPVTKPQETKPQETKPKETKAAEINVQETKAKDNTNTTTNSSNKLIPLSEEKLNDLDNTALFHLTVNNQYVDFIKTGTEKDGFLGLFGNTKYYVKFGYKLKLPEEELVTDYGNKYNNIDGNVIDCLGNKIKKYSYWIPSYTIYTNTKQDSENIKEYIESGNDYTAYFFDAMIESTGKYKVDPKSAIFKVPFTSDIVKYARPSKTPNIKLEQDDDGVQLIDGYGMSVNIGKDISEVRIEFNKNISEDLSEKIMNYDLGHQAIGANIIDNYGHKILKFYYSSFGTYAIYAENYQEAEEIASELNNNDCDYTLYFYDNVKESTGKHKVDESKALFKASITSDMIKNAAYTKTKDMKAVIDENGLQIMEGLNVSLDVGEDIYEIRIDLAKSYKGDLKEKIANYYFGHQDIGANIVDNYGHKILRFYDSSFGTYAIHAETEEEAKEITSVLNSSNCNYVLYFFDNVIASTGKNKVDTGSAKFNIKFTKDMVKYATAKQDVERMASLDSEGFELMDGLGVSIEEGNDLFEVRIEMNQKMSESNKNKITTYDVAHFEGYGKDKIKTKIYDNYGHRINRFYDSSFGTFMINAEDLDQAKEIASELNSSTCDYTLYFFD